MYRYKCTDHSIISYLVSKLQSSTIRYQNEREKRKKKAPMEEEPIIDELRAIRDASGRGTGA
jgi:hypothetical protein